jgi:hypothetical protein
MSFSSRRLVRVAVEVSVLEHFGAETELRKKWMRMWEKLDHRILRFPDWMQAIILEDVNTALKNRIATMEMIAKARRTRQC